MAQISTSVSAVILWFSLPRSYSHVGAVGDLVLRCLDPGILGEWPLINNIVSVSVCDSTPIIAMSGVMSLGLY